MNIKGWKSIAAAAGLSFITFFSGPAFPLTITAGFPDDFAAPPEPTSPSSTLLTVIAAYPHQDFDQTAGLNGGSGNTWVAHTFTGLPSNILGGTLELKLQAGDYFDQEANDDFRLAFVDDVSDDLLSTDVVYYWKSIAELGTGSWNKRDILTILLDLGSLPLRNGDTSLIPELNNRRFLDVMISDETAVDYMRLTLSVPEPTTLALLGLGLAAIVSQRRRRAM